jgi:hypothetical protein
MEMAIRRQSIDFAILCGVPTEFLLFLKKDAEILEIPLDWDFSLPERIPRKRLGDF